MEEKTESKKDKLFFLYSLLKRLGCGDVDTFEERLRSQKVQYFAQLFRVSFKYQYNLYIRGPYSPTLAKDLYEIKNLHIRPDLNQFIPEKLESRFNDLTNFISKRSNRELELGATFHWLYKVAGLNIDKARQKLAELKDADSSEIKIAEEAINEYERIKRTYN